jgi:hypothetical protein
MGSTSVHLEINKKEKRKHESLRGVVIFDIATKDGSQTE